MQASVDTVKNHDVMHISAGTSKQALPLVFSFCTFSSLSRAFSTRESANGNVKKRFTNTRKTASHFSVPLNVEEQKEGVLS